MTTRENILSKIKLIKQDLKDLGVKHIGLFGSYSRNDQNENSDIDILIDFEPEKEYFDNFMLVCELIENLFKDHKIEIITKNGLSPHIGPKILNEVMYA
jgi:predicted nucleotidyltransferase